MKKLILISMFLAYASTALQAQDTGSGAADLYSNPQNNFRRNLLETKLFEPEVKTILSSQSVFKLSLDPEEIRKIILEINSKTKN